LYINRIPISFVLRLIMSFL